MKIGLWKKGLVLGIILLFVVIAITPSMGGTVVEKTTSTTISSPGYIQDLIDNANDGDTLNIPSGTYYENIVIDKSINLIGEDKHTTIIDGGGSGNVVSISGGKVHISGFTIQNGGECGISAYSYNTISNNIINDNNNTGIYLGWLNSDNIVENNSISNSVFGLSLIGWEEWPSIGNIIVNNSFFNTGLIDTYVNNNTVINNTVNGKPLVHLKDESDMIIDTDAGQIILIRCNNITVQNQQLCNTTYGLMLENTYYCHISNNTLNSNNIGGIQLNAFSCSNTITGNTINYNNGDGISLAVETHSNTIIGNTISSNNVNGISLYESSNSNTIYHNNFIKNTQNAYDEWDNIWDDGYPSGGNFWDDYNETDSDGDGIGDTPYPIPGGDNEDRYPLIYPTCNVPPNKPIINGPNSGEQGIEYEYTLNSTDLNEDPVMYFIEWGDNTTEWTEYSDSGDEITLKHNWSERGDYTIKAKARDIIDAESSWSEFKVEIPRTRMSVNSLFLWLFERFPLLEKLLSLIKVI